MLSFLPGPVKGSLSFLLYFLNTVILCTMLFLVAFLKVVFRFPSAVRFLDRLLIGIATLWIDINGWNSDLFNAIEWDIRGVEKLNPRGWYLVIANHQSWVDILVLQKIFNRRIPFLKFFLKKELIWVPFLGIAWWALDFPFMRRYSRAFLAKNPHLKGKDLESTKKACEKFKRLPVSVMNFVEGTRFSTSKHRAQNSVFDHLLMPRAGGVAFVLGAMGDCLHQILNVTIVYPGGADSFWGFLSGRIKRVVMDVEVLPITEELTGDYFNDDAFKTNFCEWLNRLWEQKDQTIAGLNR